MILGQVELSQSLRLHLIHQLGDGHRSLLFIELLIAAERSLQIQSNHGLAATLLNQLANVLACFVADRMTAAVKRAELHNLLQLLLEDALDGFTMGEDSVLVRFAYVKRDAF